MDTRATPQRQDQNDAEATEANQANEQLPQEIEGEGVEIKADEERSTEDIMKSIQAAERNLESEIDVLKDQLLRAVAETENLRRRTEKQVDEAGKYAVTNFARDLINVLENLYRASEAVSSEALEDNPVLKNVYEGVEMTKRELITVFERYGISRIDPEGGEAFDPHFHQAVAHIAGTGNAAGTIAYVMQAGYTIKDRLLRPAMVGVAKEGE